jgi:hypothetical protein
MAIFTVARLQGPSEAQRAAVRTMEARAQPAGRNGFAALWVMPYAVPAAQRESLTAEDVARYVPLVLAGAADTEGKKHAPFVSVAESRYPDPGVRREGSSIYCGWRDDDCLDKVAADQKMYGKELAEDAPLLERVIAVSEYDYVRNLFAPGLDMPIPAYQLLARTMTQSAYLFVSGKVDEALAATCRDASTARMLTRSGDNLIGSMIGAAMLRGSAYLFTDMLSRLPAEYPLPNGCLSAFVAPGIEELSVCEPMRGEFVFGSSGFRASMRREENESWVGAVQLALTYNEEKTIAQSAANLARSCSRDTLALVQKDEPVRLGLSPGNDYRLWSLQCVDNAMGCILNQIAAPAYSDYQLRLQDSGARLRLVGALLWLRANAGDARPVAEKLKAMPHEFGSESRKARLTDDGKFLVVDMFDQRADKTWQVRLPAYLAVAPRSPP